ncbi:hypothetical protein [Agromyces flavus]|uniref:hypothetical protein n=1 Tax=Agromyces flavus TaxID=589382 RepID=UPI0014170889|nr:hypothetical protein [Agromyces flavus]
MKSLTAAKTRLAPEHSPAERAALARAFALDTVDAARAAGSVRRVVVVSDEPVIERELREVPGVEVVPEVGPRGLAAAIARGIAVARAGSRAAGGRSPLDVTDERSRMHGAADHVGRLDSAVASGGAPLLAEGSRMHGAADHPRRLDSAGSGGGAALDAEGSGMQGAADHPRRLDSAVASGGAPLDAERPGTHGAADHPRRLGADAGAEAAETAVAVLLGDMPSVRATELDAALEVAARHPLAFVPDAEGTGTTLATARAGMPFDAHFGQDSAARHRTAGFADLAAEHPASIGPGLRRDVDTAAELREAVALGVGARTSTVLRAMPDLAEGPLPRHPLDPSIAPHGADRKAAS